MSIFKNNKIKNIKSLPGFLELKPNDQIAFNEFKKIISEAYELYGFIPLDNATIERAEVLFAKAGGDTEKEIYRIKKGDNDLALRFDLTVPLARYVAANYNDITFPFRRYQIEKVFRGERPQKGRFRELYQCDIDIIGDGELDLRNDAEIPSVIYNIFTKMNIGPFVIKISNRKILGGLLDYLNLENKKAEILRIIDKIEKIGQKEVMRLLSEEKLSEKEISTILNILEINGPNSVIIEKLKKQNIDNSEYSKGVEELETVINYLDLFNIPKDYYQINLTIVRGLDYYTGTVYETFSTDYPEFGSLCSGGRYENLAEFYTSKKLPGVGVSIGLTRLFSQMQESGILKNNKKTISDILIIPLSDDMKEIVKIANNLRRKNIKTEIYLENKPLKKKMNYANQKGFEYVLVVGENEIANQKFTLKNMINGEQFEVDEPELAGLIDSLKYKKI